MNIEAFAYYLSTQFSTHIRIYDTNGVFQKKVTRRIDLEDDFFISCKFETTLLSLADKETPVLACINDFIFYGIIKYPAGILIAGPIHTHSTQLKHSFQCETITPDIKEQLFIHDLLDFTNALLLIYNANQKSLLTVQKCLSLNCIGEQYLDSMETETSSNLFQRVESNNRHNPYSQEQREMLGIETGNIELLTKSWEEQYSGSLGCTSKDPIRNGKNLAIIVVALATRAAIRGGLMPEVAMTMGDTYMREIEETKNVYNIALLTKNAEYGFASMVHNLKNANKTETSLSANPLVSQCKDYIFSHLHSRLTTREVAEHFFVHPNYLSSLFTKETGLSLYQYILSEKIALVKNLLIYSEYSLIEISSYLGFSSQSHLGKLFRKNTGMTLKQYRNAYGKTTEWDVDMTKQHS